jgi:hypothetical protein
MLNPNNDGQGDTELNKIHLSSAEACMSTNFFSRGITPRAISIALPITSVSEIIIRPCFRDFLDLVSLNRYSLISFLLVLMP